MSTANIQYRPPWTDSEDEDDYDGFIFGDDIIKKEKRYVVPVDPLQELIDIIDKGDIDGFRLSAETGKLNRKAVIFGNYTILAYACHQGQLEIVDYILTEWKQSANINYNNNTPLVCVCDRVSSHNSLPIIEKLLQHGAIVDGANSQSQTPLMLACMRGHLEIVHAILPKCRVNCQDALQCTALFYAIEGNHLEIVKALLAAGADTMCANRKGYTPRQVAENRGFSDILDLMPPPVQSYTVPPQHSSYNTLRDYLPQIFARSECPVYFQDVCKLLTAVECEHLLEYFHVGKVTLAEFLLMDEARLQELGIGMAVNRKRVLKLLMDFHLNHWRTTKISKVTYSSKENFYDILMIAANHLHNLTIANASVCYVMQNVAHKRLGDVALKDIQDIREQLQVYKESIKTTTERVAYLSSFSPAQYPLYIDYAQYMAKCKRQRLVKIFRYSTVLIGLTIFVGFKVRKLF